METRKNSRTEKYDTLFCEISPATHSSCCSLINFTVWMKQVTWLSRDFGTYFGQNWGVSY